MQNSVDPRCVGVQWDSKRLQVNFVILTLSDGLEWPYTALNQNLLWKQKEGNDILRNTEYQETVSCPFSLMFLPYISWSLMLSDDIEGKGKTGQLTLPFPCCPSLLISSAKGRTIQVFRSEIKTIKLVLCRISTIVGRIKYIYTYVFLQIVYFLWFHIWVKCTSIFI